MAESLLLSIVEMGGYPDFGDLYRRHGYRMEKVHSMRKAQAWLKRQRPRLVVAEFHFDPELRDRMGNIESLQATLQRYAPEAKLIVFYDQGHQDRLDRLQERFPLYGALTYPIDEQQLDRLLVLAG